MREVIIDATNKPLGRLASEIAVKLRGKDLADFEPRLLPRVRVVVENFDKVRFTGKKFSQKLYRHHTGYPGHLKEVPLERLWAKRPHEVLRRAVSGMLPKNRLRARFLRQLVIR